MAYRIIFFYRTLCHQNYPVQYENGSTVITIEQPTQKCNYVVLVNMMCVYVQLITCHNRVAKFLIERVICMDVDLGGAKKKLV